MKSLFIARWLPLAIFVAGCAAVPASPAGFRQNVFHFSPSGDDERGDGSLAKPWRSIAKANALDLQPGESILFEAGQTFDGTLKLDAADTGAAGRFVTVGSYGNGRAIIDAGEGDGVVVHNAGWIRLRDLDVRGAGAMANHGDGVLFVNDLPKAAKLEHVEIDHVLATGFGRSGIAVRGSPADNSQSGWRNVRITHCVARDNLRCGIYVTGAWDAETAEYANADVTILDCEAADNGGDSADVKHHSGNGIFVENVDGALVDQCRAYHNGFRCDSTNGGPVGIWAATSRKVVIQNCVAADNGSVNVDGGGFDLDGGVSESILQYNQSENNDGAGFLLCSYPYAPHDFHDNVVRFNLSVNDGRRGDSGGICLVENGDGGLRGVRVHYNTVRLDPPLYGQSAAVRLIGEEFRDVVIHHNHLITAPGVPPVAVDHSTPEVKIENNRLETRPAEGSLENAGQ